MAADFWNNPDSQGGNPVVRHAPDDGNYHFPDHDMLGRMPGSKVGAFAVVPSAKKNGLSPAFHGGTAGVVHVDPDCPDGGAIVDLSRVNEAVVDEAVATSNYPHEVYYRLGSEPELQAPPPPMRFEMPEQPRVNPVMPGAYVVPASGSNGVQKLAKSQKFTPQHSSAQAPVAMPPAQMPGGMTPPGYSPTFQAQETFVALPQPSSAMPPPPQLPGYGQQQMPQMQGGMAGMPPAPQMPYGYPGYGYGGYPPPPPQMPNQDLTQLTQMVAQLAQQVNQTQREQQQPPMTKQSRLSTMPVGGQGYPNASKSELRRAARAAIRVQAEDELYDEDEERPQAQGQDFDEDEDFVAPPSRLPKGRSKLPTSRSRGLIGQQQERQEQDLDAYQAETRKKPTRIIAGFETLEMDFVSGPAPEKPRHKVFFEFSRGKLSAMFHSVIVNDAVVALIYDTRYEGSQFVPPESGESEPIMLYVNQKDVYRVNSMGLNFSCGVLDVIVLVRNEGEE